MVIAPNVLCTSNPWGSKVGEGITTGKGIHPMVLFFSYVHSTVLCSPPVTLDTCITLLFLQSAIVLNKVHLPKNLFPIFTHN